MGNNDKSNTDGNGDGESHSKDPTAHRQKSTRQIMDCVLLPRRRTTKRARINNDGNESNREAEETSSILLKDAGRIETPNENSPTTSENNSTRENSPMPSEYRPTRESSLTPSENSATSSENNLSRSETSPTMNENSPIVAQVITDPNMRQTSAMPTQADNGMGYHTNWQGMPSCDGSMIYHNIYM